MKPTSTRVPDPPESVVRLKRVRASHPRAKLTEAQIAALRSDRAQGLLIVALAEKYGISKSQVSRITRQENW